MREQACYTTYVVYGLELAIARVHIKFGQDAWGPTEDADCTTEKEFGAEQKEQEWGKGSNTPRKTKSATRPKERVSSAHIAERASTKCRRATPSYRGIENLSTLKVHSTSSAKNTLPCIA